MKNFQLYRTNLLLGGQMKWDIIISSAGTNLEVSDFHLTPISNNVSYIDRFDDNLLNNTHQDNIKAYYKKNKGIFYEEGLESIFKHNYPVITQTNKPIKCYSNIYHAGCKRSVKYTKYSKQFEFLCPLWLEKLESNLSFKINIYDKFDNYIASRTLKFEKSDDVLTYHNKFSKYLYNYIEYIGLNKGDDNLININFNKSNAMISGVDASTGLVVTREVGDLMTNIISRERPMMEVDNMIIQSFVSKTTLAKQLFNFNICFDINDIVSWQIAKLLVGKQFKIVLEVSVDGETLEKRDFYTNYEYIEKYTTEVPETGGLNVFDYLADNKAIELINKNKYCQKICHWSLAENNDYIFNVYDGFSGVSEYENKTRINEHHYMNYPDLVSKKVDGLNNSDFWLNIVEIKYFNDYYKYVSNNDQIEYYGKYINEDVFISNLKFKKFPKIDDKPVYVLGLFVNRNNELYSNIIEKLTNSGYTKIELTNNYDICYNDNYIIVISSDIDNFAYANFVNAAKIQDIPEFINHYIDGKIEPSLVLLYNTLSYSSAQGPFKNHSEIEYFKKDGEYNYVFRYDGKLTPTFVNSGNNEYYKDYVFVEDVQDTNYAKYSKYKFEPLYPSIDYCAVKSIENIKYDELPKIITNVSIDPNTEYSWFDLNNFYLLDSEIEFVINVNNAEEVKNKITEGLTTYYGLSDENTTEYIFSLYNTTLKLISMDNGYTYDITLTLK